MHIHTMIDILLTISCLLMLAFGIGFKITWLITTAIFLYLVYPFGLELAFNTWHRFFFNPVDYVKELKKKESKLNRLKYPIVYSPEYTVNVVGLEKFHPFDAERYNKVYEGLIKRRVIIDKNSIHIPTHVSRANLLRAHSSTYLLFLNYTIVLTRILEIPLCVVPAAFLRYGILEPMGLAAQGTIDAGLLALIKGWAVNIGGGFHHASYNSGGGFCIYADITMCIQHLRNYHGDRIKKVMIIDLDAHQCNGPEMDFMDDPDVFIVDAYNPDNYPYDFPARKAIASDIPVYSEDTEIHILNKYKTHIEKALETFKPDFIIYNAGTDCLAGDPLGRLNISADGVQQRDEDVFEMAFRRAIPIVMLLSGGYQEHNAEVIVGSIENITRKFGLL